MKWLGELPNCLGDYTEYEQVKAEEGTIKLSIEDYDDKAKIWHSIFFDYLPKKEELPLVDGICKVLDVGCHTGYNTKMLEEKYGYAEGIDMNKGLLRVSVLNHDKCKHMFCEDLKYDDRSFSLIVAKDVYEHSQNPDAVISEAYRVLADNGHILIMIPLDGEVVGLDDVILHPSFNVNNHSHLWKATHKGVIARLFNVGFTEMEAFTYAHSQLFGEVREYGDNVVVIKAKKVESIRRVPIQWLFGNSYWAAFLTFNCAGDCDYCIQHLCKDEFLKAKMEYSKNEIAPQEWVDFYNSLQKYKDQKLGVIGGEPTIYKGFFDVINGIGGYHKTVTTNLKTPAFDDINAFSSNIVDKRTLRINTSFHPEIISVDEFCNKIHQMRGCGLNVDQIAMVDHPTSNFKYYYNEFIKRGLVLNPQTFLGKIGNVLLPNPESDLTRDHKEHGITSPPLYNQGFSCEEKNEILCMTRRFMTAPDGGIYRCHYHLYSKRETIGNIRNEKLFERSDYSVCNDFGYCNPCDFPHAKFKPTSINIPTLFSQVIQDEDLIKTIVGYFTDNEAVLVELVSLISTELYLSDDVYWELYNNLNIRNALDSFVNEGGAINNSNALLVAQFDGALFRQLPYGINIYRLLTDSALYKYIDAMGYIIFQIMQNTDGAFNILRTPGLTRSLDAIVASLQVSVGTVHVGTDTFVVWKLREGTNE
jgi:SAM-dependent methyltransferase